MRIGGDEETGYVPMNAELCLPLTNVEGNTRRSLPGVGKRRVYRRFGMPKAVTH
jgi:hypothetical protein